MTSTAAAVAALMTSTSASLLSSSLTSNATTPETPAESAAAAAAIYEALVKMYGKSYLEESTQTATLVTVIVLSAIALLSIFLRCFTMAFVIRIFQIDDWLMILNALLAIMQLTFCVLDVKHGLGKHYLVVSNTNLLKITKLIYAQELAYLFNLWTIKAAVLFFYSRLSPAVYWQNALWATHALNTAVTIVVIFMNAFQCSPISGGWNPLVANIKCIPETPLLMVPPALNLFLDLIVLTLPGFILSPLQVSMKRKLKIFSVLSVGLVSVIASCVRIAAFKVLLDGQMKDVPWSMAKITLWSAVELHTANTAANMPAIKALITRCFFGKNTSSNGASYERHHDGSGSSGSKGGVSKKSLGFSTHGSQATMTESLSEVELYPQTTPEDLAMPVHNPPEYMPELRSPSYWRPEAVSHAVELGSPTEGRRTILFKDKIHVDQTVSVGY